MTFAKFFSIRSLTFNLILHILQSCIYYYVKKQFHNFLTLFDTTIPKYKQFQTFSTYFPQIQRSKVIKIDRKIDCISKKKHTRTYTKNTNEKKSLHFVRRLTSSSSCRERKQGKKSTRRRRASDTFHSWPSKWASNFPRCINEPVIKLPIRDSFRNSIERNKGGKPVSSILHTL